MNTDLEFFCRLLEQSSDLVQVVALDGTLLYTNLTWRKILGYVSQVIPLEDAAQMRPTHFFEVLHPDDRDRYQQACTQLQSNGSCCPIEVTLVTRCGVAIAVEGQITCRMDAQTLPQFWCLFRIIGDRKRLESNCRQAEIGPQEQAQLLGSMYEGVEHCICIIDVSEAGEFRYVSWNRVSEKIIGIPSAAIAGKTPEELFGEVHGSVLRNNYQRCLDTGAAMTYEEFVSKASVQLPGGDGWWLTTLQPLKNEHGRIFRIVVTAFEISDRKATEVALKQTLQELHYLVEHSPLATIRWNREFRIEHWSSQAEAIFGWRAEEVRGKTIQDWDFVLEDDLEQVERAAAELLHGKSCVVHNRNYRKDGAVVDCEWYNSILLDESGHLLAILSLVQDVSQRRAAELALQKSETRYRAIVEDQTELIARFLPDGTLLFVNDAYCRYFGKSRSELLRESYLSLVLAVDRPIFQQALAQITSVHPVVTYECRVQLPNGAICWQQWADRAIFDAQGQVVEYQGVGRDITVAKEAQAALQRSQQRYRNLVNSIDAIVWEANLELQCTFVSQQVERILGYPQEQWLEPNFWINHLHPDDRQRMVDFCYAHIAQQQDHTSEYRMIAADGRIIWLRDTTNVIVENGQAEKIQGILIDISERKQSEEQLQFLSDRLSLAIKSGAIGIWDWDIANNQLNWDERMCELYGIPFDAFDHTIQTLANAIHPEDREATLTLGQRTLQEGVDYDTEFRVIHPDGSIRFIKAQGVVQRSAIGTPQRMIGINLDVTNQRQAEAELRQNQTALAAAQRVAHVGSWEYDVETQNQRWSEEMFRIFGLPPAQTAPTFEQMLQLIHPEDREQVMNQNTIIQCLKAGAFQPFEHRLIRPDGSIRQVEVRGETTMNDQGQVVKLFGTILDITDRKKAETQLQQANEYLAIANAELARANCLKDEFLANMSHELRTPLSSILGLSEVLQSRAFGPLTEKQQQFVNTISSSGEHLLSLINDILDLAKIESGKFVLELEATDLQTICETSLNLIWQQAQQKEIVLEAHLPSDPVAVVADGRRLRQVLINLLSNGVKFTPAGGSVTLQVTLSPETNTLCLQVIDTGIGIAPADIPRLFQPFVQIDSSLSRHYEGTGLGLALVRQVVELHGGEVEVTSELGRGSCFTITLPWKQENRKGEAQEKRKPTAQFSPPTLPVLEPVERLPHPPTLLLVDDNPDTQRLLGDYLQLQGFQVLQAANGCEALSLATSHLPQIILMDIQMPGMDGLETIRQLKNIPKTASIPVIALTALAMSSDRDRCLLAGAVDYLSKPMNLKQLLDKVNLWVGKIG